MRVKLRYLLLALAATVTAGAVAKLSDKPGGSKQAGNTSASSPLAQNAANALAANSPFSSIVTDGGPEETLARIFAEIEANRLGNALQLTEALLRHYPNYRLANLIKGDLLLAKTQPIQTFGALSDAPADKVADLRAEALVRLKAYREKPPADTVPRYLKTGQWEPHQTVATLSNAMDVSRPNNWPRVEELCRRKGWALETLGSGMRDDAQTRDALQRLHQLDYLCEPHGAIAWDLLNEQLGQDEVGVFLCTAHPAKFKESVDEILNLDVPLPGPLAKHAALPLLSHDLPADFGRLKAFLLG